MADEEIHGVGGWLLFFVFVLILLSPLFSLLGVVSAVDGVEKNYPSLFTVPAWVSFQHVTWTTFLIGSGCLILSGLLLCIHRKPVSVAIVVVVFWLAGPAASIFLIFILPQWILSISIPTDEMNISFCTVIGAVLSSIVWTLYLLQSKRVQNTYLQV